MISDTFNDKNVINLKLGDFGLARQFKHDIEQTWTQLGTALYAGPEVDPEHKNDKGYDYKTDIWSIGCIVYELCTKNYAFWDGRTRYDALEIRRKVKTLPIPTLNKDHKLSGILSK